MNNGNNVEEFEANKNLTDDELAVLNDLTVWERAAEASKKGGSHPRRKLPKI